MTGDDSYRINDQFGTGSRDLTPAAARSATPPCAVDNTDWLKTAAIILVIVDHIGYFFMEDDLWWAAFGRLAAPAFFFLLGYAQTRRVPRRWILLGVILTLLNSWNEGWTWVAPNILLSFVLIRLARPYAQKLLQRRGWTAFAFLVSALLAMLPVAGKIVDYGAEGWLWALFGLCQRVFADSGSVTGVDGTAQSPAPLARAKTGNAALMRLLAGVVAAAVYVWQEQREFSFPEMQFAAFVLGLGFLFPSLCLFRRGPSRIQPPAAIAGALRFVGRHTLEIYAIQLAGSEVIVMLFPEL